MPRLRQTIARGNRGDNRSVADGDNHRLGVSVGGRPCMCRQPAYVRPGGGGKDNAALLRSRPGVGRTQPLHPDRQVEDDRVDDDDERAG